jgi:hypothetical protein
MDNCINYNNGHCTAKNHKCVFDWPNGELCEALFGKAPDPFDNKE